MSDADSDAVRGERGDTPKPAAGDPAPRESNIGLARRLARAVRTASTQPGDLGAIRSAVRELARAAKSGPARLAGSDGELMLDDAPLPEPDDDARLLASRLLTYGVDELTITPDVAAADLTDLVRLIGSVPPATGAPTYFAGRAAAIDSRTVPRRLRAREAALPVAELGIAPPPRRSSKATPAVSASIMVPAAEESDRLREALPVPATANERLAATFSALERATGLVDLRSALDELVNHAELAFRAGNDDGLIESLVGLVALEFAQLERDSADHRRQAFSHAVRRLARPVLLRHLAVLRHRRAGESEVVSRLQVAFHRFGTDGVDALIDEFAAARTLEARGQCLAALRGLQRTFDALHMLARDAQDPAVAQAANILAALGGPKAQELLTEMMHHPSARARRAAVGALARLGFAAAQDGLRVALGDESPTVRARAIAALAAFPERPVAGVALLAPLLDHEPEREVLYAAVAALGTLGGTGAVQLLVRIAEGGGDHQKRRSPSLRVQACTALVAIRTPTAMACVQGLANDREREVRDAAVRLVAQAQRRTTQPVVVSAP